MFAGLDPLFIGDAGTIEILLIVIMKVVVAFALLLVSVMLYIWWMRKFIGAMQNRVGPSRAGPFGILQTLADGIKLFFKEDLIPNQSDKLVFKIAPFFSIVPALLVFTVVPVAGDFSSSGDGTVTWFGNKTFVQLADPHVGILFVLAMSSIAVYGIMLAGWSSGSKYPLLGSVRASAQMVSYEAALGLALVAVLMKTGTLSTHDIALSQNGGITDWGLVITGFIPFIIFFIATTAELNSPPFDLVEAEQELVGGFHTEYSSIRFALFFMAEFMNVITMSAVMVTLFFGGPGGYYPSLGPAWLWGLFWFVGKVFIFASIFVWMRGTLPRPRYDQLMDFGWKILIPLALGWVLLLATLDVFKDRGNDGGLSQFLVLIISVTTLTLLAGLLMKSIQLGKQRRELDGEEVFG
ncbi:MAG: NADH-quinone oxidoreductase subunit NuoH [Acidimicrobiaceae bacterium]|nr:NADH-quinone oxidoreductase subunit NuoH [Acidimicrobiaceae bacterium]MEC7843901.1 NADH-quinone oxidoreductase subunit NuoH [Actinomycetota bacterium]